jgi:hypothetical protein
MSSTPNDVVILELFQKTDFTDGSAGYALVFSFEPYFLQSDNLIRGQIASFVHYSIRSWSQKKEERKRKLKRKKRIRTSRHGTNITRTG